MVIAPRNQNKFLYISPVIKIHNYFLNLTTYVYFGRLTAKPEAQLLPNSREIYSGTCETNQNLQYTMQ